MINESVAREVLNVIDPYVMMAASLCWEMSLENVVLYGGEILESITRVMRQNADACISEDSFHSCMKEKASSDPEFQGSFRGYMKRRNKNNLMIDSNLFRYLRQNFRSMIGACCPEIWSQIEQAKQEVLLSYWRSKGMAFPVEKRMDS